MEWQAGRSPSIEEILNGVNEGERALLLSKLVAIDLEHRRAQGELPAFQDYFGRFPDRIEAIKQAFLEDACNLTAAYDGSRHAVK
jgi:hypothetical protein